MKFKEYEELVERLEKLFEQWNVRYNLFYKIVKDELSSVTKVIGEKLRRRELQDAFNEISELGAALERVHIHLQDLGTLYSKMWDLVKDKI